MVDIKYWGVNNKVYPTLENPSSLTKDIKKVEI